MFGIHCPTGWADNLGYELLGLAVSMLSPPMIAFVIIELTDEIGCCGRMDLLLMSALELSTSHTGISSGLAGMGRGFSKTHSDVLNSVKNLEQTYDIFG